MEQLIVLGNGFDLSIGMKTKYEDFFSYLKDKLEEIEFGSDKKRGTRKSWISYNYKVYDKFKINFNFWAGWFNTLGSVNLLSKNKTWTDIEKNLKEMLDGLVKYAMFPKYQQLIKYIDTANSNKNLHDNLQKNIREIYFSDWIYFLVNEGIKHADDNNDIYDILMLELNKFEEQFAKYLCDEVINEMDETTLQKRERLLKKIMNISNNNSVTTGNIQILNFNYTPIKKSKDNNSNDLEYTIRYIHGALKWDSYNNEFIPPDDSVIFGIDDTKLKLNNNFYKFGKTYRIMNSIEDVSLDLNRKLDLIKFYGHSLNEADYAYFQSIFDKVDLYGSNVKLCFYYGDFEKNTDGEKSKFMDRIYKLIEMYGENTFKNTSDVKGKNLLHKLILEGRIKTKYVSIK